MLLLGLTGSIGMGKSVTAGLFAEAGVPVLDADAVVHRLYAGEAVAAIEAAFPGTTAGHQVDRGLLSAQVMGDPAAVARLEAIVHPMVRQAQRAFLAAAAEAGSRTVLLDIPLLFETGGEGRVDAVIVVSAPEKLQRVRVLARPGMTPAKLDAMLARQTPDSEKRRRAHFVVDSSTGLDSARGQVRGILRAVASVPGRRCRAEREPG